MKSIPLFGTFCLVCGSSSLTAQTPVMADVGAIAGVPPGIVVATQRISQERLPGRVTIDLRDVTIEAALRSIAQQAGLKIAYANDVLPKRFVTVSAAGKSVDEVLAHVLRGTGLDARISVGNILRIVQNGHQEETQGQGTITGRVLHAKTRQPLAGVKVTINGGTAEATTGADGVFRLTAPAGLQTMSIRHLGFVRQSKDVVVTEDQTVTVNVELEPSANVLGEVVVTGTVVATERKAIATPITVITAEEIEKRGITRIDQLFRGEIPGVLALETGTQTYANVNWRTGVDSLGRMAIAKVYARGTTSLNGAANPLKTYVDGVELLDPSYLGTIDPAMIERVEVITGPQAATIYGSGAMGGVMQIFTKKGSGNTTPDITLNLRYGMLENSVTSGKTASHNHAISATGGAGPSFSYTGTASYTYTGQWQPGIFNRRYGGTVGITHTNGAFTAAGSVGMTQGTNGTFDFESGRSRELRLSGVWSMGSYPPEQTTAINASQTIALSMEYRPGSLWHHRVTFGRNQTQMALEPSAPVYESPSDSLYKYRSADGHRTTVGYNVTFLAPTSNMISSTITLGMNGSLGTQTGIRGTIAAKNATSYNNPGVSRVMNDESWGGFASTQVGVWSTVFLTLGLRAERNPTYGERHKIDWTPTNGLTYAQDIGDLTVKLFGSYGRATRAPAADRRREVISNNTRYRPETYISRLANPNLTPEYSRGPQGGLEIYYGNLGSLTINRYQQTVTDLIQSVVVDSFPAFDISVGDSVYVRQSQWQNAAKMRQHGWELTGTINVAQLTLKGAYSWNDSRVLSVSPLYTGTALYPGKMPIGIPSHSGSMTIAYTSGATSVTLVSNYVGASNNVWNGTYLDVMSRYSRIMTYNDMSGRVETDVLQPGYVKSDLAMSHRVNAWVSVTANISNLGNSYGSEDLGWLYPVLGRQTLLGVSLKFPRR